MDKFQNIDDHATQRPSLPAQPPESSHTIENTSYQEKAASEPDSEITQKSLSRLYALIIDDDKAITFTFSRALQKIGYRCDQANSAKEALNRLALTEPDLVLLDLRIGHEIDGEDILLQIRTNPRLDQTSVIVISAYPEMAPQVAELADLVIVKPVDVEQLQKLSARLANYRAGPDKLHITDPITGLYNRNFFYKRLENAMERARRHPDFFFATLALRVDPQYNSNGDPENGYSKSFLRAVARRLQPSLRPTDTTAFLYDKTFATLLEDLRDPQDIQVVIERIENTIAHPYQIQDKTFQLSYNLAAVVHDKGYKDPDELFHTAEETLKLAHQSRQNCHLIVPAYGGVPLERMPPLN